MRTCACGCGASLEGRDERARYATDACRARGWKAETGYGRQAPREVRTNGREPTQLDRVERALALNGSIGITQADFDSPNVIDGMPPIPQIARRIHDLRTKRSLDVVTDGTRQGYAVYKLARRGATARSGPAGTSPAGLPGNAGPDPSAGSLFDAPVAAPTNALLGVDR